MPGTSYTYRSHTSVSPGDVHDQDAFPVKIVAIAGWANDWAAYMGPSHWTDARVANQGTKIDAEAAKALFYVMAMSGRAYRG